MIGVSLSDIIKKVIEAVQSTNLTIISIVCDQDSTNAAVLNL